MEPAYIKSSLSLGGGVGAPSDQRHTVTSGPPGLEPPTISGTTKDGTGSTASSEDRDEEVEEEDEAGDLDEHTGAPPGLSAHDVYQHSMGCGGWNGWQPPYPHDPHAMGLYSGYGASPWSFPYGWPHMYMGGGVSPLAPPGGGYGGFESWAELDESPAAGLPPPPPESPMMTGTQDVAEFPAPPPGIPAVAALDARPQPPEPPPGIPNIPAALEATQPPPPPAAVAGAVTDFSPCASTSLSFGLDTEGSGCIHNPFAPDIPDCGPPGLPQPPLSRAVSTPAQDSTLASLLPQPPLSRAKSSPAGPLPPQPPTITQNEALDGKVYRTQWTVDARKLKVKDKVAVSPSFELGAMVPGTFRMMLYPTAVSERKGGASFKKAKGKGSVHVKCESPLGEAYDKAVTLTILVCNAQEDASLQEETARGPVKHNFAESGICSLPKDQEEWDFGKATDEDTQNFVVILDILDPTSQGIAS